MNALTPASTLTPFTTQHGECEKKKGEAERRDKVKKREAAFVTAETTVFVSQHHGDTRATNVKQTKTRGISVHRHTHELPSGKTQEQESDSQELSVLEWDGEANL